MEREEDEEGEQADVERIIQHRDHKELGPQYKVRWTGFNNTMNSWVRMQDLNCSELLASFQALQRQRGTPVGSMTDAQAEKFYYGTLSDDGEERAVVHDGIGLPAGGPKVSAGPQHTTPWVRPAQKNITVNATVDREKPWPSGGRGHGLNELGRERGNRGVSVFRDQEGAMGPPPRIGEQRYLPMTLTPMMPYEQTRRVYRPGEKGVAIRGKGKGKGFDLPEASHVPVYNGTRQQYAANDGRYMGASLADKVEAEARRGGARRVEVVIERDNDRLVQAAAQSLAFSLSKNTQRAYGGNFNLFLGFCKRQNLSPFLDGTNKRTDEATLIQYTMYEWDVHKNKYATIKLKLAAIRSAMMEEGYPNPLEGKFTLDRHLKGIKVLHGATSAKEPLPAEAFRNILEQTRGAPLMVRAAALASVEGFFFLLRISEFAGRDGNYMESFILQRCDVTFYSEGRMCAWNHPDVDAVELYIRGSKTDQRKQGCRRMQEATGDPIMCPVKCMVEWFTLTEGSAIPSSAPRFSVPKGREGLEWDVLTRDVVTLLIKGAAADCGMDVGLVGTHSIRISGATALLLAGVAPEVVQIIGRWASNAFIGYTRYQAELMKGVAMRMGATHYVVQPKRG